MHLTRREKQGFFFPMPLSSEDQFHVTRAEGFLALGMAKEAETALGGVSLESACAPEVLVIRLSLFQKEGRWAAMQAAARRMVHLDPANSQWAISLAYATRRAESTEMARLILLEALDRFPEEPVVHYNLACYDCELDDLSSAREFLKAALRLSPEMKSMAREDEDLQPLWKSLAPGDPLLG